MNLLAIILPINSLAMGNKWVHPKTITGDAATGDKYLRRDYINDAFWREVEKGNHILFVAPRRVGKTSVMKDLEINHPEQYACIYENIEGVKTKNEFYKRLFEVILECSHRSKAKKMVDLVNEWWKRYGIEEISKSGVKIKSVTIDYENELRKLVPELSETQIHTVIFLDEFAEVISKLNKSSQQNDAIDILHTLREIRSDDDFRNFTIVFAGSVGLHFVIKNLDRPKLINDLHPIEIGALTSQEAKTLLVKITNGATIQFTENTTDYLLEKINHLLPYFIQLMIEEIDSIAAKEQQPQVTENMVDMAFEQVLRVNKNFEDWLERLRDYQPDQFSFINEILKQCAHKNSIMIQEIFDLACNTRYNRQDDYMDFVDELVADGYIMEAPGNTYRFVSPFLQKFWLRKYPILNTLK